MCIFGAHRRELQFPLSNSQAPLCVSRTLLGQSAAFPPTNLQAADFITYLHTFHLFIHSFFYPVHTGTYSAVGIVRCRNVYQARSPCPGALRVPRPSCDVSLCQENCSDPSLPTESASLLPDTT